MEITEAEFSQAKARIAEMRKGLIAIAARYDRRRKRIVVDLSNEVEFTFPPDIAQGLAGADPADLAVVEVSPSGLGLHWPRLDTDFSLSGLLAGEFGTKRWMASELGAAGGRVRSKAKAAAARENGLRGGRPRKRSV
jgi:hypothetical protein